MKPHSLVLCYILPLFFAQISTSATDFRVNISQRAPNNHVVVFSPTIEQKGE